MKSVVVKDMSVTRMLRMLDFPHSNTLKTDVSYVGGVKVAENSKVQISHKDIGKMSTYAESISGVKKVFECLVAESCLRSTTLERSLQIREELKVLRREMKLLRMGGL